MKQDFAPFPAFAAELARRDTCVRHFHFVSRPKDQTMPKQIFQRPAPVRRDPGMRSGKQGPGGAWAPGKKKPVPAAKTEKPQKPEKPEK